MKEGNADRQTCLYRGTASGCDESRLFELNGQPREVVIKDESIKSSVHQR
ncbi:hypothetical protein PO124_06005 [Bacillus licheniformis]|nr:hypothetical protein [Bacillus licheniformis]